LLLAFEKINVATKKMGIKWICEVDSQ